MADVRTMRSFTPPAVHDGALDAGATGAADGTAPPSPAPGGLKILHVLRAPLGGLFRHVLDVTRGQVERGHQVGLIVDSTTGGARADTILADLAPHLALGVERVAMRRELSPRDLGALHRIAARIGALAPDVLHGHGAKGAAFVRLALSAPRAIRVYTPHGGSLVYSPGRINGTFYRALEWVLKWRTDLFLFESSYIAEAFRARIGRAHGIVRVVRNGVSEAEFKPVVPVGDATDLVTVGELRNVKAIDVLLDAVAMLKQSGRRVSATIAGEGPERASLQAQADRLGLGDRVRFVGYQPARDAFAMGRILIIPSRAESLPYIVLEAAAAGVPIIATNVGGVPEIFGPEAAHLVAVDDRPALAHAIGRALDDPTAVQRIATTIRTRARSEFSLHAMVEGGLAAYREALAMRKLAQFA
jgi:glycosyltransferase involved in cell wall biosynthesis